LKIDRVNVAGLMGTILILLFFSWVILTYDFPIFDYAGQSTELIATSATSVGKDVSRFLWTYRSPDLVAQAFVLLVSAVSCTAILKTNEEKK